MIMYDHVWSPYKDLNKDQTLTEFASNAMGRTIPMHLGWNDTDHRFTALPGLEGTFQGPTPDMGGNKEGPKLSFSCHFAESCLRAPRKQVIQYKHTEHL